MADFQKSVNMYPAIGVHGAFASVNPVISTAEGYTAAVPCPIGGFVWELFGQVAPTGEGKPLGFVARDIVYAQCVHNGELQEVPAGDNVNVQVRGDFYVEVPVAVEKGQKVFASTTDGKIVAGGEAGSEVAGAVETDFTFVTAAAVGEIAIISSY